jgi:hypothetical protein
MHRVETGQSRDGDWTLLQLTKLGGAPAGGGYAANAMIPMSATVARQGVIETPRFREARAKQEAAQAAFYEARAREGELRAKTATEVTNQAGREAALLDKQNADEAAAQAAAKERLAQFTAERDKKVAGWQTEAKNINPDRLMDVGGNRAIAAIAMMLGAAAQGLSGGKLENTAMKIINRAMDQDYAAQKDRVGALKEGAALSSQILADARATVQTEAAQRAGYNIGVRSALKAHGDELIGRSKNAEEKATWESFTAQIAEANAKDTVIQESALLAHSSKTVSMISGAAANAQLAGSNKDQSIADVLGGAGKNASSYNEGRHSTESKPQQEIDKEARKNIGEIAPLLSNIENVKRLNKEWGSSMSSKRLSAQGFTLEAFKNYFSGQASTDAEAARHAANLGDRFWALTAEQKNESLDEAAKYMADKARGQLSQVSDSARQEITDRLVNRGYPEAYRQAILTGTAPQGADTSAPNQGGTNRPR